MDVLFAGLCSGAGAALATGVFAVIQYRMRRKDEVSDKKSAERKALRYLMLYIIQERAKDLIRDGGVTLDDRRSLRNWHDLYHNGLGGNGDADALMAQVDKLPLKMEE